MQYSIIPIFLTKINVARQGHFSSIKVDNIPLILNLLMLFEKIGIIRGYHVLNDENKVKVYLRYVHGSRGIFYSINQVSTPGRRVYVDLLGLTKLKEREGINNIYIISSSKGLIFDSECYIYKIGGEVIIRIIL